MDTLRAKAAQFLEKHGMSGGGSPMQDLFDAFVGDMNRGLAGQRPGMLMIPTYMSIQDSVPVNEPIIVMDAGGTNFRVAVVTFREGEEPLIEHFAKYPMPGTKSPLTKEEFLDAIADYMAPVLDKSDRVGFCFSYPAEILQNRDGRLIKFTKEVRVSGVEGMMIGAALNETLQKRGHSPKQFVLLNDTVAVMFSGFTGHPGKRYSGHVGLILGTGTNTCYVEQADKITKISGAEGSMAINMESGGYAGFAQGDYDKELDQGTVDPGLQRYEKMISGAYQGHVIFLTLRGAVAEGLFSPAFASFIGGRDSLTMRDVDTFYLHPFGDNLLADAVRESDDDRRMLFALIDGILDRAARLLTVNVGSILIQTGAGTDPTRPVCVIAEGTAFNSSGGFREKLSHYVRCELNDARGLYCEFVGADNATLIGAAAAGLMN